MNRRPPRNGEKRQTKINTLLVDGNALFKVGYFASKNMYNSEGKHIGGVYAFMTLLRKLLTDDLYHQVYVFWDGNFSGKLRYDIYKPYKSARGKDYENGTQPIDQNELYQRKRVWEYLNELYVRQLMDDVIESDDFIAYYCHNKAENEHITIASTDRDFLQLISNEIRIYFIDLKEYVALTNYSSYFCYHQSNAVLVKTMVGDSSDSIKGIKGLGEETLISNFPMLKQRQTTLNEIIDEAKRLQTQRLAERKKPLKVLDNIINAVTDGVQKEQIYEINELLVNLSHPMMTEKGIREIEQLKEGTLDTPERDLKTVFMYMEMDGLDKALGDERYKDFLDPFKKLIQREKNINLLNNKQ